MPLETRAERIARLSADKAHARQRKKNSRSSNRSKGKLAPGRKKTRGKDKPPPIVTARKQAMADIRRAAAVGDMRQAQDLFFAWAKEAVRILQFDDWTDVVECELDWLRSEIGSQLGRR